MTAVSPAGSADRSALMAGLAILKVNSDRDTTFLDNFVPFMAHALLHWRDEPPTLGGIQQAVKAEFGLELPQGPLNSLAKRVVRLGLATRDDGRLVPDKSRLENYDLSRLRRDTVRQQRALSDKLRNFASSDFGQPWSTQESEEALLAFVEEWGLTIAAASASGEFQIAAGGQGHDEYVLSSFVAHLLERDPQGFGYLENMVKGSMLASALYLPDLGAVQKKLDHVTLCFDTPFLLEALGYLGPDRQVAATELLDLVYQLGARLTCFERTLAETQGVLHGIADALRHPAGHTPNIGSVEQYFVTAGLSPSDVQVLATRVETNLASLRIHVRPEPPPLGHLTVDELALEDVLQSTVGYMKPNARLHDLNALTAVHRLRKGTHPCYLESCGALFVTTNHSLVKAAQRFFKADPGAPLAILHHDLATLAWLKNPTAAPNLPRRQIIADVMSALQPSDALWMRYLEELERVREASHLSSEDYFLLRYSDEARDVLMSRTLGQPEELGADTVSSVLAGIKQSIIAPLEGLQARQAVDQTATAGELAQVQARLRESEEEAAAERERRKLAERHLEADRLAMASRCRAKAVRRAKLATRTCLWLPAIALVGLGLAGAMMQLVDTSGVPKNVVLYATIAFVVLTIAEGVSWLFNFGIRSSAQKAEVRIATRLQARYLRELGA